MAVDDVAAVAVEQRVIYQVPLPRAVVQGTGGPKAQDNKHHSFEKKRRKVERGLLAYFMRKAGISKHFQETKHVAVAQPSLRGEGLFVILCNINWQDTKLINVIHRELRT